MTSVSDLVAQGSGALSRTIASIGESMHQVNLLHRHSINPEDVVLVPGFKGSRPMLATDAVAMARNPRITPSTSQDGSLKCARSQEPSHSSDERGGRQLPEAEPAAAAAAGQRRVSVPGSDRTTTLPAAAARGARGARSGDAASKNNNKALATSLYW